MLPDLPFVCTTCGTMFNRPKIVKPGHWLITVVLVFFYIIPAVIFEVWRTAKERKCCPSCGAATVIPSASTFGQRIVAQRQS